MKRVLFSIALASTSVGIAAFSFPRAGHATRTFESPADISIPRGYRDWRLISVAHEEGKLNDIRATLGNDVAVKAFRADMRPFPDGTVIARLAWNYVASEENDKAFGRDQSFIAGSPTNVQFMIKDSKKYASTGGWGFAQFTGGNAGNEAVASACLACHQKATRDSVFTHYAR